MAVCHPFVVGGERGLQSVSSTVQVNGGPRRLNSNPAPMMKKRTFYYLVPAITSALVINIPKFLEFRTVTKSVSVVDVVHDQWPIL